MSTTQRIHNPATALTGVKASALESPVPHRTRGPLKAKQTTSDLSAREPIPAKGSFMFKGASEKFRKLQQRLLGLLTSHRGKQSPKQRNSQDDPAWLTLSREALQQKCETSSKKLGDVMPRLIMPMFVPKNDKWPKIVAKELDRLSDLLINDQAGATDVAHYILFSYFPRRFNPTEYGESTTSSLHVRQPPACLGGRLLLEIDEIENEDLRLAALWTITEIYADMEKCRFRSRWIAYVRTAQDVFRPQKTAEPRPSDYY